jgi:GDP-L-fucose synthase
MNGPETPLHTCYTLKGKRVFVAGHRGMVGSAIVRRLEIEDCTLLTVDRSALDLRDQAAVRSWLARERPDAIFLAAARVGGILANDTHPADFLCDNIMIETNVVEGAFRAGVGKLLFLGSSCIYPRMAPQPIHESALLTGPLEPTNEWYAVAKIAGIKLCQALRRQHGADFISAMPTNLYGPNDNYDLASGHVVAALIRKTHEAKLRNDKRLVVWGTGTPLREFLHVDDAADAMVFLMKSYSRDEHINIGYGDDLSIAALTDLVANVVGFEGQIERDLSKPDGTPRKLLDSSRLREMGWSPRITLEAGLKHAYEWYLANESCMRAPN